MLNVPAQPQNIDVCLVPTESIAGAPGGSSTTSSSDQLPAVLRQYTVMALTAFDPPGTMRERDANAAANARLWADIMQLPTAPSCAWRSFGFDNDEGWREDGFCLAFDDARMPAARHAVLELARRHDQGAIFEYYYDTRECRLMRRTLGACLEMLDEAEVALTPVSCNIRNPLLQPGAKLHAFNPQLNCCYNLTPCTTQLRPAPCARWICTSWVIIIP